MSSYSASILSSARVNVRNSRSMMSFGFACSPRSTTATASLREPISRYVWTKLIYLRKRCAESRGYLISDADVCRKLFACGGNPFSIQKISTTIHTNSNAN